MAENPVTATPTDPAAPRVSEPRPDEVDAVLALADRAQAADGLMMEKRD